MKAPTNLLAVAALAFITASASGQAVSDLLAEAQRAYVKGDSAGAKEKFELVRRLEPDNRTATLYLRRILAEEAANPGNKNPANATQSALAQVILPRLDLREASLGEVLEFLRQKGNQVAAGKVAINFVAQLDEAQKATKITLNLQNVPFTEALRYVGELGGVQFSYERFAIVVKPKGAGGQPAPEIPPAASKGGVKVEGL
jgi:hypothetical protein